MLEGNIKIIRQNQLTAGWHYIYPSGQRKTEIDTVILDYGNTLVLDPFTQILESKSNEFQELLNAEGYKAKWQQIALLWTKANKEINLPFISHFYQEAIIVEQALRNVRIDKEHAAKISQDLLEKYRQGFKEVLTIDKRRNEVSQTLGFLKNKSLKLAVLSNEREFALDIALRFYGIIDFFDLVLSSEKVGVEKPDAKVFCHVLKVLDSKPKTTVYVGDDPIRDVLPTKKIGMTTVLYIPPLQYSYKTAWRSPEHLRIKPDFVIRRFRELKRII